MARIPGWKEDVQYEETEVPDEDEEEHERFGELAKEPHISRWPAQAELSWEETKCTARGRAGQTLTREHWEARRDSKTQVCLVANRTGLH